MRDVYVLDPTAHIDATDPYIRSYRAIESHFRSVKHFDVDTFTVAAHAIYGWMPTILELHAASIKDLEAGAKLLNQARSGTLVDNDLRTLTDLVNNSLVGVSKLLHFAAPSHFAIWDSRVYQFVFERAPYHYRMNSVPDYRHYHEILNQIAEDRRFPSFHERVNRKVGYAVSAPRAIEVVMYSYSRQVK